VNELLLVIIVAAAMIVVGCIRLTAAWKAYRIRAEKVACREEALVRETLELTQREGTAIDHASEFRKHLRDAWSRVANSRFALAVHCELEVAKKDDCAECQRMAHAHYLAVREFILVAGMPPERHPYIRLTQESAFASADINKILEYPLDPEQLLLFYGRTARFLWLPMEPHAA